MKHPLPTSLLLAALALSVAAGCKKPDAAKKAGQAQAAALPAPVDVAPAKTETAVRLVPVTGSLQALQTVELLPKVAARVVSVAGREGDPVRAGQVIVQQDVSDLNRQVEQARALADTARTRLAQAQTTYETQKTTSASAVRDAQAQVRAAQEQLALTRRPQRSQEVIVAENNVKQAKANYDKAVSDQRRYAELFKEGATAAITLDQYRTQAEVSRAALDSARQQLTIARQGGRQESVAAQEAQVARAQQALTQAEANRSQVGLRGQDIESARSTVSQSLAALAVAEQAVRDAALVSPIDGVIADRKIEPGQLASPGQSVMQIVSLSTVYFEAQINEQDVSRVREGQTVFVTLDAYPSKPFTGKIVRLNPSGSATGRTFNARVVIANTKGVLRPGLFARGNVVVEKEANQVTVPVEALLRDPDDDAKATVFTAENGVAHANTVRIGLSSPDGRRVAVTGLSGNVQVVVTGQRVMKDGDKVTATPVRDTKAEAAKFQGSGAGGGATQSGTSGGATQSGAGGGAAQ